MTPKNAHDAVFAFAFGSAEHAGGLLRGVFPPALTDRLDWPSLKREPANFVDAKLKWRHSDLLFSVRERTSKRRVWLYVLIEHQSKPDRWMALRLLRYMLRAWDERLKAEKRLRRLPLILPIVVYSGRRPWRAPRSFRALLEGPDGLPEAVERHVLDLQPAFVELNEEPDAELTRGLTRYGRLILWAMAKAGDDRGVIAGLRKFADVLGDMLRQPDGQGALEVFWRYLFATHARLDRAAVERFVVEEVEPKAEGERMTITVFDRLIEKGRKEGRSAGIAEGRSAGIAEGRSVGRVEGIAEGRCRGRAELLLEQLSAKFGALSAATRKRVESANLSQLARWGRRVLTARTISDVFDPPSRGARRERRAPAQP